MGNSKGARNFVMGVAIASAAIFGQMTFALSSIALPHDWRMGEGTLGGKTDRNCTFKATYPVIISTVTDYRDPKYEEYEKFEPFRRAMNMRLFSLVQESLSEYLQSQDGQGQCSSEDHHHLGVDFDIGYSISYSGPTLLSVVMGVYSYTGGAHGLGTTTEFNYDLATETAVGLQDMLVPEYLATLFSQIADSLLSQNFDLEFGFNRWKLSIVSLADITNFHFTDKTLVVSFDPYEVGPYVMGPVDIEISWDSIRSYIRPDGPAKIF